MISVGKQGARAASTAGLRNYRMSSHAFVSDSRMTSTARAELKGRGLAEGPSDSAPAIAIWER